MKRRPFQSLAGSSKRLRWQGDCHGRASARSARPFTSSGRVSHEACSIQRRFRSDGANLAQCRRRGQCEIARRGGAYRPGRAGRHAASTGSTRAQGSRAGARSFASRSNCLERQAMRNDAKPDCADWTETAGLSLKAFQTGGSRHVRSIRPRVVPICARSFAALRTTIRTAISTSVPLH